MISLVIVERCFSRLGHCSGSRHQLREELIEAGRDLPVSTRKTSGEAELGYRLRKSAWGKVFATEGWRR